MASSEYGGVEESEPLLEETDVYKATTSSDYVVVRRLRLYRSKFITYHNIEENEGDNKQWILTAQCELQPRSASEIKEPCTKYVRPRGQWAITTLVKPKSIGSKGQPVKLYMFTLSWPTRWAAKGYTSFAFGFTSAEAARHWHNRLSECLDGTKLEKASSAITAAYSTHARLSNGNAAALSSAIGSGGGAVSGLRLAGSAAATPSAPTTSMSAGLAKVGSSLGRKMSSDGAHLGLDPLISQMTGPPLPSRSPEENSRRPSVTETAKRALVYDNGGTSDAVAAVAAVPNPPISANTAASSFFTATAAATAAAGSASAASAAPGLPPAQPASTGAADPAAPKSRTGGQAAGHHSHHHQHHRHHSHAHQHPHQHPPAPRHDGGYSPSSSDSEGADEDSEDGPSLHVGRGSSGMLGQGVAPCRMNRGTARGDVRHSRQRWVPWKQVNGVAIYHRPQTDGDAEAGVGGEFMVSTVVRGSPRRCLNALTSNCGNTSILGPATTLEVLERRQAVDGKEVQRIVLQAPGLAGVICAPREVVVETVFKTDETGPTLVLMFNSCEVPARFVERRSGGTPEKQQQQDEAETVQTALASGRRSWWRRPVAARVRGGYTIAPLEEYSLDNSPEALVTCIMKVDLGGVCGERSWLRLASDLAGWTDAFLDRMLMAVTLLRDEVEQGRFVVQPLSMISSAKVKDRERDGGSTAELGNSRSMDGAAFGAAVAMAAGGGGGSVTAGSRAALTRRSTRAGTLGRAAGRTASQTHPEASAGSGGAIVAAAAARAASKGRKREAQADRPSLVDAVPGAASDSTAAPAAAAPAVDLSTEMSTAVSAAGGGADADAASSEAVSGAYDASPVPSPSAQQYETLEDVLVRMRGLSFLDTKVWDNLHRPGKDAPFKIRGPTYLKDRKKIPAGYTRFVLGSMDVIEHPPGPVTEHVARYIPAIRQSGAPFSLIIHLVIPGTPLLGIVATFVSDRHPSQMGSPPAHPMEDDHDWEPFDFVLHKYMTGTSHTRNHMLKLIPHIADGSWMIKQSVGTTPVILGKQLRTIYYETPQYLEIDIDISANNVASYVTGLVRGATRSLVIDMGFVLEGTTPWELPEALLGTLRLYNLDIRNAKLIDVSREIPLRPSTLPPPRPPAAAPSPPTPPAGSAAPSAPTSSVKPPASLPPQPSTTTMTVAAAAAAVSVAGGPAQRQHSLVSVSASAHSVTSNKGAPSAPAETPRTPSMHAPAPQSPSRAPSSAFAANGTAPL